MITRRPILLGGLAAAAFASAARAQDASFDGEWNGALHVGARTLRLHLTLQGATATLISIDQGGARIPGTAAIDHGQLTMTFPAVGASFVGQLTDGRIAGQFTQGQPFPLTFERGETPAVPATPPAPRGRRTLRSTANGTAPCMWAPARCGCI